MGAGWKFRHYGVASGERSQLVYKNSTYCPHDPCPMTTSPFPQVHASSRRAVAVTVSSRKIYLSYGSARCTVDLPDEVIVPNGLSLLSLDMSDSAPEGMPPLPSNPDEDDGPRILAATITVTAAALISLCTRLYVRLVMIRNHGWDDAIMTLAMLLSLTGLGLIIPDVMLGAGKHIGDIDPANLSLALKLNFITQPVYLIAICVVKLSVGAALLRIASQKIYKIVITSLMVFMGFYTTGCFFTVVFQCQDLRVLWDPTIQTTCWTADTLHALSYTNVTFNIITDLCFSILIPGPMLWKLNASWKRRATLMVILGLGVFSCIAAMVKVKYLVNYGKLGDWLWDSRDISIWTVVETNIGITAGCLACLRPMARRFLGTARDKSSARASDYPNRRSVKVPSLGGSKNWQSLSSGRRDRAGNPTDETSSERELTTKEDYELGYAGVVPGGPAFVAQVQAKSSNESMQDGPTTSHYVADNGAGNNRGRGGITRTTTTTVSY
ncbi:hypothetical protein B0H66DRAFT_547317 [Apodospora peruviana]|uniref:Rhodopsin domain-containing protein n=1 Tax=Apodospora peruviana TaxID=516989 RepID=A0AAE0IIN3_9PEZI|nr:hypothetical protein B0H66DRAFT_547317 [Apodospora peruviana]